jgi:aminopeptidase N
MMAREQLPTKVVPRDYKILVVPDAEKLTFHGCVKITVDVIKETTDIVLNAHPDLTLEHAASTMPDQQATGFTVNVKEQRVTVKFPQPVAKGGTQVITIQYRGKINRTAQGLFVSPYDTPDGPERMLLTQFERIEIRRFMPCWDEPALKATFALSTVIAKEMVAISNMPVAERKGVDERHDRVCFETTPPMSTYLLFLGIGKLERLERRVGATTVAVVARQGSACKGRFALDSAVQLLAYYNDYFGVEYPLPKLDLIAAPGAGGFSAMENWGAILYFETELLVDPKLVPESARQRVFAVVAHEMAHQWFGNLVTMRWWNDLWLNEGFATWMQNKAEEALHPEWMAWFDAEVERQRAMRQDAMPTAHAIVRAVDRPQEAAFDDITYRKGAAVIRMIEVHVGADGFRRGVGKYMVDHPLGNATTAKLWKAIKAATGETFRKIADDFTTTPGFPVITLKEQRTAPNRTTTLTLEQDPFAIDVCLGTVTQAPAWSVPVTAFPVISPARSVKGVFQGREPIDLDVAAPPPIKLNSGQTGYYRSRYTGASLIELAANFTRLPAPDQVGLLYDLWALGEAGSAPIAHYFDLIRRLPCDAPPPLWRQVIKTLLFLDSLSRGLPLAPRLRAFGRVLLAPLFARLGWDAQPCEPGVIRLLREELLEAFGRLEARSVVEEARTRVGLFLAGHKLPGAIRKAVLQAAALWADGPLYFELLGVARRETDALAAQQLWAALASARDEKLAAHSLEFALAIEPTTLGPMMIKQVARDNPDLAWRFALDHLSEIKARLDEMGDKLIPSLAAQSNDRDRLPELRRYLDDEAPAGIGRELLEMYYCELQFRLHARDERLPEIDKWLGGATTA